MTQECLTIPQNSLYDILKFQPESVIIQLFDRLMINSDSSPLTEEEEHEITSAKTEFYNGDIIPWKK